jgi:hypothetical protein
MGMEKGFWLKGTLKAENLCTILSQHKKQLPYTIDKKSSDSIISFQNG